MCGVRKNTLVIDFSVLPARPDVGKVQQFLEKEINLEYSDVKSIQLHNSRNCVFIEMKTHDIVSRYQSKHNWKRTMLCAEKEFRIPVYVDCEAVTVRIHDLSPSVSNSTIGEHMLKYGEVLSIRDETWKHYFPGIPNGVRVLRMNLLRDIPSFITIAQETTMVSYLQQPKSCRLCGQPAHPGKKCLQPTSLNDSATASSTSTSSSSSNPSAVLFSQDEFPPINDQQELPSPVANVPTAEPTAETNQQNDDECTDEDNASSSSSDYNEATHKRRRSMRENEAKKVCADQCSSNTQATGHEEKIDTSSKGKNVTYKIKTGKGYIYSRK